MFCGMKEDDVNTFGQMSPTDKTCYIYRKCDYPSALVCECNYDIRPEYAHSFVNQVGRFHCSAFSPTETYTCTGFSEIPLINIESNIFTAIFVKHCIVTCNIVVTAAVWSMETLNNNMI